MNQTYPLLARDFFQQDAQDLAQQLLGKILCVKHQHLWLRAQIIETEAYYLTDKASHASLGYTKKRAALFMPAGTIYMYYARGGDSLNISAQGEGDAVLIKSAIPLLSALSPKALQKMRALNPKANGELRSVEKLCAGQTLLCKALGLKVPQWDAQSFDVEKFYVADSGYRPKAIIQTARLGIPSGRDHDLPYRFIDYDYAKYCTANPLKKRDKSTYQIING